MGSDALENQYTSVGEEKSPFRAFEKEADIASEKMSKGRRFEIHEKTFASSR